MRKKIGFRTVGFRQVPLSSCLVTLSEIGYDGVEICLEHPEARPQDLTPATCEDIRRRADGLGLQIASVSYHGDADDEAVRAENQLRAIDITPQFGTGILIINPRKTIPGQKYEQLDAFEKCLAEVLLPRAEAAGISLACEPEPGMFVNDSLEMLDLIQRIGSPRLGINLDVGHAWLTDPDLSESIAKLRDRVLHVHLEDMPTGVHKHLVPGEGDMDLPGVVAALDKVGFGGFYTVDLFNIADAPGDWARRAFAPSKALLR